MPPVNARIYLWSSMAWNRTCSCPANIWRVLELGEEVVMGYQICEKPVGVRHIHVNMHITSL